jgi:tetratricopeptide (TPR) repeat protein
LREVAAADSADDWPVETVNLVGVLARGTASSEEAAALLGRAQQRHPGDFWINENLALILYELGPPRLEEAVRYFSVAVALRPQSAGGHLNLGLALKAKGRVADAITEYREAIGINKDYAEARNNLGVALAEKGQLVKAAAEFREAVRFHKDHAGAHGNLAEVLLRQGLFRQAAEEFRLGHELGSRRPGWHYPTAERLRIAERLADLDARLPRVLAGQDRPADAAESLELARLCQQYKHLYAASARWYGEAFTAQPALAEDRSGHRYNAACAAALAVCGQGQGADGLAEKDRTRLRKQALAWLRADLAIGTRVLDRDPAKAGPTVARRLQQWLQDPDFNGVRGADALARLPEADRGDWQKLWKEVEALHERAMAPAKKANPNRP